MIIALSILVVIFIGFVVLMAAYSASRQPLENSATKRLKSATEIADEIETISQYRALKRKLKRADEKRQNYQAYDSRSLKTEERYEDNYQILQEAFDAASKKVLRWQYIPNIELDTVLSAAESAYKIISIKEHDFEKIKKGYDEESWYPLQADDEPDEADDQFKFIIKFRRIVEDSGITDKERFQKMDRLASRNKSIAELFFDMQSAEKPSEQWQKNYA